MEVHLVASTEARPIALRMTAQLDMKEHLSVYFCHLSSDHSGLSGRLREQQAEAIRIDHESRPDELSLIMGDMNAEPHSPEIGTNRSSKPGLGSHSKKPPNMRKHALYHSAGKYLSSADITEKDGRPTPIRTHLSLKVLDHIVVDGRFSFYVSRGRLGDHYQSSSTYRFRQKTK